MTSKSTNTSKVPTLRFFEFGEEWEGKKLETIVYITSGTSQSQNNNLGKKVTRIETISDGTINIRKVGFVNEYVAEKYMLTTGDILISNINSPSQIGKSAYCNEVEDLYHGMNLLRLRVKKHTNPKYLFFYINTNKIRNFFQRICNRAVNQASINQTDLGKTKILLPSPTEQQKIALFLTAIDNKINQLTKKKKLLQDYKKGVMQKIFSQEIRFKDDSGSEYPKWIEKKLGEIFERITDKNIKNNLNVLTISAQQGLINQKKYFNKSVSAKNVTGYYLLQKGDFAYNKSYSNGYPMGAIKKLNKYDQGVVSTLYICFRIKNKNSGDFYQQYFDGGNLNRELHKIAQEGARNHGLLNLSVIEFFRDINIKQPSLPEQQKIASFLSSIDKKIKKTNKRLKQTQKFKKGLLQQMFV